MKDGAITGDALEAAVVLRPATRKPVERDWKTLDRVAPVRLTRLAARLPVRGGATATGSDPAARSLG